jgi:hypothetical protein
MDMDHNERAEEIMYPPPVLTKQDFVKRYAAGEFGNASPTWQTFEQFSKDVSWHHKQQQFHLRNRVAAGETHYNLSATEVLRQWGDDKNGPWYCSAMAPEDRKIFQGEVIEHPATGIQLHYNLHAIPMRDGMAAEYATSGYQKRMNVDGPRVYWYLRTFLCANSYEWLMILLDRYPNHAVEFSSYATNWGTISGFNTVFWEVRKY